MTTILQPHFALSTHLAPGKTPTAADVLLTFRVERTGALAGPGPRLPLNLGLVLDRSGSMAGKPLDQAVAAAGILLDQLDGRDTLSVVAFDHTVDTVVPQEPVADRAAVMKRLRKVRPGGSTNLFDGWDAGCGQVACCRADHAVNRVLLLTDGAANHGVTDPAKVAGHAAWWAARGVSTTTLGFGRDFEEDLLLKMAEASGGNFYYIETPEDACQVFQIEGETLTSVAVRNLVLTLTPAAGSGVVVKDVLNRYATRETPGGLVVSAGDVYAAEDKILGVAIEVPPQSRGRTAVPLVEVSYTCDLISHGGRTVRAAGSFTVAVPVSTAPAVRDVDAVRQAARLRVAAAKEDAVRHYDALHTKDAEAVTRAAADGLRQQQLDEEFDLAEEAAQLDYYADRFAAGGLSGPDRKTLRDQAYQGRTRGRDDLAARGSGGGSAHSLPTTAEVGNGVEVRCVRDGGKLRVEPVSAGFEREFRVLFPRAVREPGVHYVVDGLELSANGTFYKPSGAIKRLTKPTAVHSADPSDPLKLTELFAGGGEPWLPVLKPVIEVQPRAGEFIGPNRDAAVVPMRELTFQALKPNPPEKWKVVVFGQNPYPRAESATGIAMFDNTFADWADSKFGKVTSIRCVIKAAVMSKHGLPKSTGIADIRKLLAKEKAVQPPEWFQAMLTQGVLLLNAALTASTEKGAPADPHAAFWRPVVEKLVEEILKAKQASAEPADRGVVFGWWGAHARNLRSLVERLQQKYPGVRVRHVDHCNPAAQGDVFCDGDHFGKINAALRGVGAGEIDWLPSVGWNAGASDAERMGAFITQTQELHKLYLERLQEVAAELAAPLPAIVGVLASPLLAFPDAVGPLVPAVPGLDFYLKRAHQYGQLQAARPGTDLSADEIAAVYLYTTESSFHRRLNAVLRDPDRDHARPYFGYLRLLLTALPRLAGYTGSLWRGVAADLRRQYPKGGTVTWWGVSSCTAKRSVATSFMGGTGRRTLFEITPAQAVGIRRYSAFTGEDEYVLLPGARLAVTDVTSEPGGLATIRLREEAGGREVS
ncbi:VWA domain-containing protein [Urbifossiella limnaea]|uniref:NAD(+)--protein-arginine ADP-ribosyltransferase n=1 Tax=Urbifossiella limnaea TaxID=2528023 RepID=A0A517XQF5_9BACT|nr:VWA domain-containing protein [Urbifossiella limnaea]QDU19716.1 Uracil-DNA glycosylase [Urbifossiella limnaea]